MKIKSTLLLLFSALYAQAQMQFVAPMPGSTYQNPNRNIVIRPGDVLDASSLTSSLFSVSGSKSGDHTFKVVLARDKKTINLNPYEPFAFGETVKVTIKEGLRSIQGEVYKGYDFS